MYIKEERDKIYKHKKESKRKGKKSRYSDGYTKEKSLDLKVNIDNVRHNPSLLSLASKPATRTNLDLYYEDTHEIFHNGGYTNILTAFKAVDNGCGKNLNHLTFQQSIPDYISAVINYTAPAYYNTEYSNYNSNNNSFTTDPDTTVYNTSVASGTTQSSQTTLYGTGPATNQQKNGPETIVKPYQSYCTRRNYDRNLGFQGLYNNFANNTAFSDIQALHPGVFSLNDTSPLSMQGGSYAPVINTLMAQWDAVNANMLFLVMSLRMYKITKVLLNKFADRHLALSGGINQALSAISTLRYVKLLDDAADKLSLMPCDHDYIENYSKRQIPSLTGSSYYDPILIPSGYIQKPQYQIQFEGGTPFTPGCENDQWLNETSHITLTNVGYSFNIYTQTGSDPVQQHTTKVNVPAGYQIVVDGNNNMYYYLTADETMQANGVQTGGYNTGVKAPYIAGQGGNVKLAASPSNITAEGLLTKLQSTRNAYYSAINTTNDEDETETPPNLTANYMTVINDFRNNGLNYLQTLVDKVNRFNIMMAPFASLYQVIENSGLAKYHACRGEGDIEVTAHYDGGMGDGIKHPEVCIQTLNNVPNTAIATESPFLNAHNQYGTGIALKYIDYDSHLVDSNSLYSVAGSGYYNTAQTYYYGNTMYFTPFTDANEDLDMAPAEAFDQNGVSYNTYMLPKAIINGLIYVHDYYGNLVTGQVSDKDEVDLKMPLASYSQNGEPNSTSNAIIPYPQAGIPVCVYDTDTAPTGSFNFQYLTRFLGVIAYSVDDAYDTSSSTYVVDALGTDGYTSYLPITTYNDITKYYDETVAEHPFTVKTKPNASKVLQVAN